MRRSHTIRALQRGRSRRYFLRIQRRDRGHGRRETRTVKAFTLATPGGIGFPHAQQAIRITRTRIVAGKPAAKRPT